MYRHSRELSELARGQGLLSGGVEVECFSDDLKAFTLTGQPILKPTDSVYGRTAKPYRKHQLALPKTYVTRRGQMVLFTSTDDMLFGKSCQMHQREATSQHTAKELKTTSKLYNSAMDYGDISEENASEYTVRAGHFTNVYLNSLQKAAQTQRDALEAAEECVVEDIEEESEKKGANTHLDVHVDGESEAPLVECDSGLGYSVATSLSGRLSAQSHTSDMPAPGTVITIPHGKESQTDDEDVAPDHTEKTTTKESALDALKKELAASTREKHQPNLKKKTGKKRRQTTSDLQTEKPHKTKSKKKSGSNDSSTQGKKSSKTKRKRTKNEKHSSSLCDHKGTEAIMDFTATGIDIEESSDSVSERLEVTAIQMSGMEGVDVRNKGIGDGRSGASTERLSRAEQRRLEIERKRAEKRALELEKKREEEERMRLQALIESRLPESPLVQEDILSLDGGSDEEDGIGGEISAAHDGVLTVKQKSLRNRLTEAQLRENRLLLAYQGEKVDLSEDLVSADEALRLAQEARERRLKLEEQERERLRLMEEQRQKEELAQRLKTVDEKAKKIREERNKSMHLALANQRINHSLAKPFMFSYFRFVPPPKPKAEKKTKKGRSSKSLRSK